MKATDYILFLLAAATGYTAFVAREAKRGLWADPNPTPPWEWWKQRAAYYKVAIQPESKVECAMCGWQKTLELVSRTHDCE